MCLRKFPSFVTPRSLFSKVPLELREHVFYPLPVSSWEWADGPSLVCTGFVVYDNAFRGTRLIVRHIVRAFARIIGDGVGAGARSVRRH